MNNRCKLIVALVVVTAGLCSMNGAYAQAADQDGDALQQLGRAWTEAWNRHDMSALASLVAQDVEWTTATGAPLKGRKAFEEDHARRHARELKEATVTTTIAPVKFLKSDVAVVHVTNRHVGIKRGESASSLSGRGILTWVLTKQDGRWLIAASHATFIPDAPAAK